MRLDVQTTIRSVARFAGVGLHSGKPVRMVLRPAPANHGIWFRRTDVIDRDPMVPAIWDAVLPAPLCTRIENQDGVGVSTIEHLMAALAGCGVHNVMVEIGGPEVPILDGSAAPFVASILARGVRELTEPVRCFEILKTVEVRDGDAVARLDPSNNFTIDFRIDFADAAIGTQTKSLNMANGAFVRELSDSRTFCRQAEVDAMQANGLALGGNPGENAVVFDGDRVASPGGLRHDDEPVRHKMLDALGDLALAGAPIIGRYTGNRAGHAMTNRLLRALFATPGAVRVVECGPDQRRHLPGAGLHFSDIPAVA
jgi:UDP-3-O-[3-hydroxymyristoyl] N-acetylglucosamine deacetylase